MKKCISLITLFSLFHFIAFPQQPTPKPIIFITDASGSMWQKIGSDFKISIAREALNELVQAMPDDQPIGLVAYGHRSKGDCNDIEELLPITNTDKAALKKALDDLNPLGKTPLAQSAKFVIDKLKAENQAASIILITDGIETCTGDLCAIVSEAKAAGIHFVLHIIGFDLGDADRTPLECAAQAADGIYVDASDKSQLSEAIKQTTDIRVDDPAGRLSVSAKRNDELIDANIIIYQQGADVDMIAKRTYNKPETNPALIRIVPGIYDVEATIIGQSGILPIKYANIVITDSIIHELLFDFSSGILSVEVTELGALHDAGVNIISKASGKRVAGGRTYKAGNSNPLKEELLPGAYDVTVKSITIKGETIEKTFENVIIKGRQTTVLSHDFESAELLVGVTLDGTLCDAIVNIISTSTGKSIDAGRTYTNPNSNPKKFLLSPGAYEVEIKGVRAQGNPQEKFTITLKAGDKVEHKIKW